MYIEDKNHQNTKSFSLSFKLKKKVGLRRWETFIYPPTDVCIGAGEEGKKLP